MGLNRDYLRGLAAKPDPEDQLPPRPAPTWAFRQEQTRKCRRELLRQNYPKERVPPPLAVRVLKARKTAPAGDKLEPKEGLHSIGAVRFGVYGWRYAVALTFDEIIAIPNGARFVRADLHIHSTASEDVSQSSGMTPEAIVDAAVNAGLEIISITDHNTIDALPAAMAHAAQYSDRLLFVPGIEITVGEGHLLAYFDRADYGKLEQFWHGLDIVTDSQGSRVRASMIEVLRNAQKLGGLCVAAHIDTKIGFRGGESGFPSMEKRSSFGARSQGLGVSRYQKQPMVFD